MLPEFCKKALKEKEDHPENVSQHMKEKNEEDQQDTNTKDGDKFSQYSHSISLSDHRYYHVFTQKELTEMILRVKKFQILDTYYDNYSWVYVLVKI